jgi:uncharacterized protein
MTDEVLENYIRQYIEAQQIPEVTISWQGGGPTLMGTAPWQKNAEILKIVFNRGINICSRMIELQR